ncbi:MAG TPA: AMP-binding protein [Ideonella sp.]|uniref:AMP-binding protein n=1 Tax=Ideonella sp. TaxID=1929293 RepID=UPI002E331C93|nr:AMP-binding protein [Ideonella sp.]HEX5686909.1 AMP-binding protein [Ideonella sp.]
MADSAPTWLPLPEVAVRPGLADRAFARRGDLVLSRADFLANVDAWQARLAIEPGRRWALFSDDSADFASMLFGAWHAGKTVLLPGDMQPATLARLAAEVDGSLGQLPGALPCAAATPTRPPRLPLDRQHTRLIVYTSGSSGEPEAIAKSLAQLDAEMHTLQAAFGLRADADGPATVVATVSHQHIYGLLFQVLWSLAAGRPFLARRLDYLEALPAALSGSPGLLIASPAHLRRIPDEPALAACAGALRAVFSSGGPLPPEAAAQSLARLGHSPIEVFGSSETGGIAWRQRAHDGDHWRALPGVDWRISDELLEVRSGHLPDAAWYTTSDRVRPLPDDPHGAGFVLLGRADRIVKVGEKRVSLSAIERALLEDDDRLLAEARALLLADADGRIAVVAVPTAAGRALLQAQGRRALGERLRGRLLAHVERVALPRRWRFVDALPVNSQGKSTEALLGALFDAPVDSGRPPVEWLQRDTTAARLRVTPDPALAVFDGHFPGNPILPGVAQLDWAIGWGREAFQVTGHFTRIDALKFQQVVPPGTLLELALDWSAERGTLGFRYTSPAGVHASGKVVFDSDKALGNA